MADVCEKIGVVVMNPSIEHALENWRELGPKWYRMYNQSMKGNKLMADLMIAGFQQEIKASFGEVPAFACLAASQITTVYAVLSQDRNEDHEATQLTYNPVHMFHIVNAFGYAAVLLVDGDDRTGLLAEHGIPHP